MTDKKRIYAFRYDRNKKPFYSIRTEFPVLGSICDHYRDFGEGSYEQWQKLNVLVKKVNSGGLEWEDLPKTLDELDQLGDVA